MTQYTLTEAPQRQFLLTEFEQRLARAQTMMRALKLDAVLLTTETNVRYFSGYFTQFWQSPTRPWFLILPLTGKPIAVIPTIGVVGMSNTWRPARKLCHHDQYACLYLVQLGLILYRFSFGRASKL